jgi:outer membrane immunogenic protein
VANRKVACLQHSAEKREQARKTSLLARTSCWTQHPSSKEEIEMKKTLLAGACVGLVTYAPAYGADLTQRPVYKAPPPPQAIPVSPVYSWTGFYIGGNGGYGWSHREFTNTITGTLGTVQLSATNSGKDNGRGGFGGGQIGFNYQFPGNWVVGIEADIDAAHITSSTSACFAGFGTGVCGTRDTYVKDFGTVRGRLGYALNNVLLYGTGGWAWGHGTNTIQFTCLGPGCPGTSALPPTSPTPTSVDVNPNGWAAGAGVEWAFLPNWTLRAEYLHLQFDGVTEDRSKSSSFVASLFVTSRVSSNVSIDLARVGLSYQFR